MAVITFIFGVIIGAVIAVLIFGIKSIGTLILDNSDPDGPYLFLNLKQTPEFIKRSQESES